MQNKKYLMRQLNPTRSSKLKQILQALSCSSALFLVMCPLLSPASPAGKWLGFVTAIWVQAICGNSYTFSNYSDALKSIMALTQLELNTLSVAKDVGKAFGLLSGIASDRWSTSVILLIGSFEGLIGYGVQWLVVSQRIHPLPYWQVFKLSIYNILSSH